MSGIERDILEELVYDRVRASVNLCQIIVLERELEESIRRALGGAVAVPDDADAMAQEYVDRAWERIEHELHDLREELGTAESE